MKAKIISLKTVKAVNSIVNYIVLVITVLLIIFAVHTLCDSNQIYQAAEKSNYAVYKPTTVNQGKSFKELQSINSEVFAWLSVYGTNIDYPVTQAQNNMKYVNTNAEGLYSLSGSIFLDCNNSSDFSNFNNILYGHHMAKKVMFGEIEGFADKNIFDSHKYGNLYFDEKDYGIEFFAFIHTDAYDSTVFTPNVQGEEQCRAYLNNIISEAVHIRDIGVTEEDQIVLLSTCSSRSTNGRDILVGRITDVIYDVQTLNIETDGIKELRNPDYLYCIVNETPIWILLLGLVLVVRLIVYSFLMCRKQYIQRIYNMDKKERNEGENIWECY